MGMDHFDGAAIDDQGSAAIWERQSQDYYGRLQKDDLLLPDPSSSFWDLEYQFCDIADTCTSLCAESSNNNVNVGDDHWGTMFHQQTPIKHCADLEYRFCDIADIIAKDFDEWNETLQAKRRRTLQFSPGNVEMTCPTTEEGGLSQSPLNLSRINRNTHVAAMEKAVDISAEHAQARPAVLKDVSNTCPCKNIVTITSDFSKPDKFLGEATLEDINEMIKGKPTHKIKHKQNDEEPNTFQAWAISGGKHLVHKKRIHAPPPHKIKHGNDKERNSFQQVSAISGKHVVPKARIRTKGNGTITISTTNRL